MSNQSNQPAYNIPHSGSHTPTPGTIVFQNGKVVARIETVTTISTEDDASNRAAEFSAAPEVDDGSSMWNVPEIDPDDGPTRLTPSGDKSTRIDFDEIERECSGTCDKEPEKPKCTVNGILVEHLDQEIDHSGIRYRDLDLVITNIADDEIERSWRRARETVDRLQSAVDRRDADGFNKAVEMVAMDANLIDRTPLMAFMGYLVRHEA